MMVPNRGNGTTDVTAMTFSVLGSLQVSRDGRAVELGPGRRRATLAALLVDVGQVVPLDLLVERVWEDASPDNPMSSVHTYVSRLRAGLRGVDASGDEPTSPLVTESPGYRLAVDPQSVDAVQFEALLQQARELRTSDVAAARERVGSALGLWRGPAYSDIRASFAEAEAARLGALRTAAQELAVELDLELGRHAVLVEQLESMVAAEPLRERLQGALMLALYRTGRPAEALKRFAAIRELLADELGADPGRELQELHARILRQDPALDVRESVTAAPVTSPAATAPGAGRVAAVPAELPMVGRARELDRVRTALTAAWTTGHPLAVTLVGEAGIGKSRLLDEVASTAGRDGVAVAWGRCWQHDGAPMLWPWVQLVRGAADAAGSERVAEALRERAAAVRTLVPELPGADDLDVKPDDQLSLEDSQVRLFDALTAFFETLATQQRTLLLLEDMHWADPASRRMAEYLVTHAQGAGLALVLSVRSPTEDLSAPGQELLAALARTGRAERIALAGLDPDAVGAYVANRTGTRLDDATARALTERTAGNPFFVGELVRLLVTDPNAAGASESQVPDEVPDSVREVIVRRVRRLGDDEQEVLRTAAVIGRTFDLDLIEDVSRLGEDEVDEAVDRATAAGFLCSEPGVAGQHRFTHALVQQTLLEDTGPARRRRLHARAAVALQQRAGVDPLRYADRLIHHLAEAGGEDQLDAAVELSLARADAALRRANHPEVEAILLHAVDLAGRLTGPTAEQREMSALVRLCALYDMFYGPTFPGVMARRRRALELARRLATSRDLVAALNGAAAIGLGTADFVATAAVADEMAVSAEATGDPVMRALGQLVRGQVALQQGQFEPAINALAEARETCADFDIEPWGEVLTVPFEAIGGWRAFALANAGRSDEAEADLARIEPYRRSANPSVAANVTGLVALVLAVQDRPADALRYAEAAVAMAVEAGLTQIHRYIGIVVAWARARQDPVSADDGLRDALEFLGEMPRMLMRPFLLALMADARLSAGAVEEALRLTERALAEATATGNVLYVPQLHRLRAAVLEQRGDRAAAADERERACAVASAQGAAVPAAISDASRA